LGPLSATWVVEPSGIGRGTIGTAARLADVLDCLGGTVRAAIGKYERLLEAEDIRRVVARTGKRLGFDLIEALVVIEHRDRRAAAVSRHDIELATIDLIDTVGDVDLHLATLGEVFDRMIYKGAFL
jgi:hypothetical protein